MNLPNFRMKYFKLLHLIILEYTILKLIVSHTIANLKNLTSISLRNLKDFNWSSGLLKLSKFTTINKADIGFERYGEIPKEISALKGSSN